MAEPVTTAALVGALGTALSQADKLLPSDFDKKQEARLRELRRKEELDLLGLSEKERDALEGQFASKLRASSERADAERQRLLAGGGNAFTGHALEQAVASGEQQEEQLLAIQNAVEQQDLAKAIQQEEELRALEAAVEQRRKDKVAATASIASAGIEGAVTAHQTSKLISPDNVNAFSAMYNIQPAEAENYLQMVMNNPRLAEQAAEHMVYMNLLNNEEL